jgi:hypothetical protein
MLAFSLFKLIFAVDLTISEKKKIVFFYTKAIKHSDLLQVFDTKPSISVSDFD